MPKLQTFKNFYHENENFMFDKPLYSQTFRRQLSTNRLPAASYVITDVSRNKNVNVDYVSEGIFPIQVPKRSPCDHRTVADYYVIDLKFIRYYNWFILPMITEISIYSFSIVRFDIIIKDIAVFKLQWSMIKYMQTANCLTATEIQIVFRNRNSFWVRWQKDGVNIYE